MNRTAAEKKDYLIELDGRMGDGDLGLTMAAVFSAADSFAAGYEGVDAGELLMKAGMMMAKAAPSTMGTLMATGFMRGGKAVKGQESMDAEGAAAFWKAFVEGIMERGKSKPGEKTIVDALFPAAEAFEKAASGGADLAACASAAADAAEEGLEQTKNMVAQHGRAAYYQEKSRDIQDPGATIGAILLRSFADHIKN